MQHGQIVGLARVLDQARLRGEAGLGLSIVRRIVDAFGGEVGVTSEPGEGSTFHILLPTVR